MFKKIVYVILVVIVIFLGFVAMQPKDVEFSRSQKMQATSQAIYAEINDLRRWNAWSPWAKIDPLAKEEFEGADSGTGAVMRWSSQNSEVGVGSMTIVETRSNEFIRIKLDFEEPMSGTAYSEFLLTVEGDETIVKWSMISNNRSLIEKAMGLFFDCEKIVGEMYSQGLLNLKSIVENR